ncbi:MAG: DUF362 domain-containing protein [Methanomassiliicoccales archaeon]|nr:DUF362 domain-containing protein [Methanomassiliicoccales archaeon]
MMESDVYFADMRARRKSDNLVNKVGKLLRMSGLDSIYAKGDLVAIKTHFGEPGNTTFIRPQFLGKIIDVIARKGGKPFLTDANTLYVGRRSNAVDHVTTATRHGFTFPVVNAPVIIADGLRGKDQVEVRVSLKHCKTVKIAAAASQADSIIGVAHFKGHGATGFGGALKNIGMGFGSRAGKLDMHCDIHPSVKEKKCKSCGLCVRNCPSGAIRLKNVAVIDEKLCIGCGECCVYCPSRAIEAGGHVGKKVLQEKIVEYCYGVLKDKKGKTGFVNFLVEVTPDCDCPPWSDKPIVPDIGILASKDIVAIDQASADLVNLEPGIKNTRLEKSLAAGKDKFRAMHKVDWEVQLAYAEKLGLGNRHYRLIRI